MNWKNKDDMYDDLKKFCNKNELLFLTSQYTIKNNLLSFFENKLFENKKIEIEIVEDRLDTLLNFLDISGRYWITREDYCIIRTLIKKYDNDYTLCKKKFIDGNFFIDSVEYKWNSEIINKLFNQLNKKYTLNLIDLLFIELIK